MIVVDNASHDGSLATISDLPIARVPLDENRGFGAGCNRGWKAGSAPAVLFLNPDARIDSASVERLAACLDADPSVGLVAPRTAREDGSLDYSVRRFPRLRSTYARALFLHRLLPRASWTDEVVRDPTVYDRAAPVEWVSGACVLVRRRALEAIGGWDENFFLYSEDVDLCRRLWDAGYKVLFEPAAGAVHEGGASAPRSQLLPLLAQSRVRYAQLHMGRGAALLERLGVGLGELTHALLTRKGRAVRVGHLRAFARTCSVRPGWTSRMAALLVPSGGAMCGICGIVQVEGPPRPVIGERGLGGDDGRDDAPRAGRPRPVPRRRRRARRPSPQHRRRRGRPPAGRERVGPDLGDPERRALQPRGDPRPARARGPRVSQPLRHRDPPPPLRASRTVVPDAAARACSASPSGTAASGAPCSPATVSASSPSTTPGSGRSARLRLRAQEPAGERARRHRGSTTRRSTPT